MKKVPLSQIKLPIFLVIFLILAIVLVIITIDDAFAQRMRNFSLPEGESLKQKSTRSNPSGNYQQYFNNQSGGGLEGGAGTSFGDFNYRGINSSNNNTTIPGQPASKFMSGYCDENFEPLLSNTGHIANLNACIQQYKDQACKMFFDLPEEAQRVMDPTISCMYEKANGGEMDENGYVVNMPSSQDCTQHDSSRLTLIKQYWDNQGLVYALVFLPDMVFDAPGRCMGDN